LVFRLDTQVDFEEAITTLRAGRYVETHPVPMTVPISGNSKPEWRVLRNMTWFERANRGGLFASETEGDLRLQPSRLETVGAADFEEHFDGQVIGEAAIGLPQNPSTVTPDLIVPEGWPLRTGAFPLPVTTGSGAAPGSANVRDALGLVPFVVRFWMKPDTFGAGPAIFSMSGDDPNADFIECRYDPGDASFHFRVHDNTLDDPATGLVEAAEVVWTPPPTMLEDDTWFHFSLHCQGTNPEDLVLLVDGFRRGQNRFVSRLTSAMSETAMSFEVEDATGWPDQGAFWIGTEVVNAYRQAGRNSYTVFQGSNSFLPKGRGARGTTAASHLQAEVVRLFGYSSVLTKSAGRRLGGEVISEGHGALVSALAPLDLCSVTGVDTDVLMVGPVSIGVEVLDLAQTSQIDLEVFGGGNIATQQLTFQESGGYALIVAPLFPAAGSGNLPNNQNLQNQLEWVAQLIKYQGRQGNRLTGITLASQTYNTELSDQQVLNNDITLYTATGAKIVTRFSGGGPNSP
ncbi:MAG: hypothetical protein KDB53_03415, partial [Planctomycetes bacterium]|nr:hypothetical protein [Planctomycetota bacterium]